MDSQPGKTEEALPKTGPNCRISLGDSICFSFFALIYRPFSLELSLSVSQFCQEEQRMNGDFPIQKGKKG